MRETKMSAFFSLAFFSILFCGTLANTNATNNQTEILESWIKLDNILKGAAQSVIKYLMPMILESSSEVNLTSQCIQQSFQLVTGLRSLKKWAFSFVDSSAKLSDGLLSGSFSSFGEYDQCLETVVPHPKKKDEIQFQGQYCMVEMTLPLPPKTRRYRIYDQLEELRNFTGTELVKFLTTKAHLMYYFPVKMGVCIPSGCTKEDLNNVLSYAASKLNADVKISYCEKANEKMSLHGIQIFAIFIICFLSLLVIIGSWMDIHSNSKSNSTKNTCLRILLSFSAISNFKRLFSTKSSMENFRCLNGIRFFTIAWVIYGHAYLFPGMFATNYRSLFRMPERASVPGAQMIINGSESVDIFFFIGGMLVSYLTIHRVKIEKKTFNIPMFVIHRLCRIIPVVYFIIVVSFLPPLMGSGPAFHYVMKNTLDSCYEQWWRNALFINNFFYSEDMCLKQTWYVSCDIQLYLISIIVLIAFIRSEKVGFALNIFIILLSIAYTGIMTYIHDLSPTIVLTHLNIDDEYVFFVHSYANVLSRAGPYFIGVFTGYILVKNSQIKLSKKILVVGWISAILSSGMIIFATAIWLNVRPATFLDTLIYSAVYKVVFTAGIAWMTFCCITRQGGFLNTILSWKVWMPLSKLVFLTYLIEPMFQHFYMANFRSTQEFSHLHMAVQFFGFLCISMLLALVCTLLVESPFLNLEKIAFSSVSNREDKKEENDDKNNVSESQEGRKMHGSLEMVASENGVDNKGFTRC
ncbi:nose resistant to fluoxetine protein 6-like [Argiope bruennichi]|uniref:nose resistant to fluoxetine protein 6-like n=1 Tax=Argiope bruennichi TaxID=94029 RepID=UPI002494E593|nr:nose resistant to fluoxetine protein 6-like [Argiope bruennichi]